MSNPAGRNAALFVVRDDRGTLEILVVDAIPKTTRYDRLKRKQTKPPGGGEKEIDDNNLILTCGRETAEETGLRLRAGAQPRFIHCDERPDGHVKNAFWVWYEECSGKLRTQDLEENDSILKPPYWLPLKEFIRKVYCHPGNKF